MKFVVTTTSRLDNFNSACPRVCVSARPVNGGNGRIRFEPAGSEKGVGGRALGHLDPQIANMFSGAEFFEKGGPEIEILVWPAFRIKLEIRRKKIRPSHRSESRPLATPKTSPLRTRTILFPPTYSDHTVRYSVLRLTETSS